MERYTYDSHVPHKHRQSTLNRAKNFIESELFKDDNLLGQLYGETCPLKTIYYSKSDPNQNNAEVSVGDSFGPLWTTHWFNIVIDIPKHWCGEEVHLIWDSDAESLVYNGQDEFTFVPVQGLSARVGKIHHELTRKHDPLQSYSVRIEMSAAGVCGDGHLCLISPPDINKTFKIKQAHIAVFRRNVFDLLKDFEVINGMANDLPQDCERACQAMYTANAMVNACVPKDSSTYSKAREIAHKFLGERNGDGQHTVFACGHCHIDSAWLWPYSETIKKCANSWTSVISLIRHYPDLIFVASSAQQFSWMKDNYSELFKDMQTFYKKGNFIPVGGTWVEMDGNMPNGESLIRQFYYGQNFFAEHFGACGEFWLPDTFGYSGQIPQIMLMFGIKYFLTQKLSWSLFNKFPHHTFWWEGLDGSRVLTHFPPGDRYDMNCFPHELLKTESNFRDKGRSKLSMFLFGHSDGGQGPTADMIERLQRMKDVDGLPKVCLATPKQFFNTVEEHDSSNLCTWVGELFLELHNGTYTSQSQVKRQNREIEQRLQAIEAVLSLEAIYKSHCYPYAKIEKLWQAHLLNQFHDVLPGSSVEKVYKDVHNINNDIISECNELLKSVADDSESQPLCVYNTRSWDYTGVLAIPDGVVKKGSNYTMVNIPSYGFTPLTFHQMPANPVTITEENDVFCFNNQYIQAKINRLGHVIELKTLTQGEQSVFQFEHHYGNQFVLYDDQPLYWDAWDIMHYHNQKYTVIDDVVTPPTISESNPFRCAVKLILKISDVSRIIQTIYLDAESPYLSFSCEIHWHESRKLLRSEFITSIQTMNATYDSQFGHVSRPTHSNTSWDAAKFEVCMHKWMDISEHGLGLSVLNNGIYGCSTVRNTIKLSLLRSPKLPDSSADMGMHVIKYALLPHCGRFQDARTIQRSYEFNWSLSQGVYPSRIETADHTRGLILLDTPQVILETVSKHLGEENLLSLRFYECFGGKATATVQFGFNVMSANVANGYGKALRKLALNDNRITLFFTKFQIISVVLDIAGAQ